MSAAGLHVDRRRLAADLTGDHRRFETWLADPSAVLARWDVVEQRIEDHLAIEEALLLPELAADAPSCAAEMRSGHALIRAELAHVRAALQGGGDTATAVRSLAETMWSCGRREEETSYGWFGFRALR